MATEGSRRRHLFPVNTSKTEQFTSPSSGPRAKIVVPAQVRQQHAASLAAQLQQVAQVQAQRAAELQQAQINSAIGVQIEFESMSGVHLAAESLARDRQGIELMNVRELENKVLATVFVPQGKLSHFEKLIQEYVSEKKTSAGQARDHQRLIDAIHSIRVATFEALWTDSPEALPSEGESIWWEAWLPAGKERDVIVGDFTKLAQLAGLQVRDRALHFPERTVVLMYGSKEQILQAGLVLNRVAELRRAKDTAEFFDALGPVDQARWVNELTSRVSAEQVSGTYVTLLDTGVNHGHPLLAAFVAEEDLHSVEPGWGHADDNGHGTQLAGLALLGDLTPLLADQSTVVVQHRLESVKLLRQPGDNAGESHGAITAEGVARVEISDPDRRRVFSMAISATDGRDRGRPSSWSAAVDRLASDYEANGASPRLFVLSAGNTDDSAAWATYPASLSTNLIHDPGQAWNALTVGAYSQLTEITEHDAQQYRAIAPAGGLSPYTTTSATWQRDWPFKPDIVMEGGNAASEPGGFASAMHSLSLLTTHHQPTQRLLDTCWATSASTALASGMAARIWSEYPEFWPETVRGLVVHSARWTQPMMSAYMPNGARNSQTRTSLLRHCGYGVPNLERALWSASNSLTMIVQGVLTPYRKDGSDVKARDMHLHDLPWPRDLLESLGETQVTMRVTLSYFIEPNPGDRGDANKYAYQSHALRLAVRRPLETEQAFRGRINAEAILVEDGLPTGGAAADSGWAIGESLRRRGSLISDSWTGTAAELSNRGQLAIYPAMGWWRNRPALGRFERAARYSLIVSIEAPEVTEDLYVAVESEINDEIEVQLGS